MNLETQSFLSRMNKKIVTVTLNPAIDKSSTVNSVAPEIKLRCEAPRYDPGGGGLNVSRVIQSLGGSSMAVYASGGLYGRQLQNLLDEEGLSHRPFPIAEPTRENLTIYEEKTGLQYRFGFPGAEMKKKEWQGLLESILALDPVPDFLVASGSLPPGVPEDFYASLADRMNAKGCQTILDTSGNPLREALSSATYIMKPNPRELGHLVGRRLDDLAAIKIAAKEVVAKTRLEALVVSLGADGVFLVEAQSIIHIPSPPVEVRSKVGAGDSLVGALVLALAKGMPLVEAVRYGVAAGTAAVMTPGTELCRKHDVERLFLQITQNKDGETHEKFQ